MPADIAFTNHAVERYIQRHARDLPYDKSLARLQAAPATKLRERTLLGQLQYEIHDPYCVLVVKRDKTSDPELVCVTVLPTKEKFTRWSDEEQELINEWVAEQAKARVRADIETPAMLTQPARGVTEVPKKFTPPSVPRDPEVAEFQLKMMAMSVEKEHEKTRRHELSEKHNGVIAKRCLRIVLRDLVRRSAEGDGQARAIAELVQQVRPEFLQEAFLRLEDGNEGSEGE